MKDLLSVMMGFAHLSALVTLIVLYCRRRALPWREWPLFVYILLWTTMVVTGYLVSLFDALNNLMAYVVVSFIALVIVLLIHRSIFAAPKPTPYGTLQYPAFADITHAETRNFLWKLLLGTLGIAFLVHLIICFSFHPVNADSLNYRLARVFWYVSHGNLLHPFDSVDQRLTFYPVNGILLYAPIVLYGLPSIFFALPSLFTWLALSYVSYRFARALKAERLIALFAAWMVAMTPSILIEASSTNDEILTATPLVIGMFFAWRWLTSGTEHYFFLAALGLGLCVGTKLHIFFLIPIAVIGLIWFAWYLWRRHESWRSYVPPVSYPVLLWSFIGFALTGIMFLGLNYLSSGKFYFLKETADQVLNLGASLQDASQNLIIYISSIILAPIADLNFWEPFRVREVTNKHLNDIFLPWIAPFVDTDPQYFHLKYRFHGVIIPTSVLLVEYGLWPAFMWLIWPLQAFGFKRQKFTLKPLFLMVAATPVIWIFIWSCVTLYMEGVPTYFAFYLMCAAPAMVMAFAKLRTSFGDKFRWWIIAFVVITNIIVDGNVAVNNTFRGLWHFSEDQPYPYDWLRFEQPIIDEIKQAKKIQIAITHGKVYYFAFMHWNPRAIYYSPYKPAPATPDVLHILTTPSEFNYGFMPLKIPDKATPGLTYLGRIRGVDREAIFAFGNNVHLRYPTDSDFISLHLTIRPEGKKFRVSVDPTAAGLSLQDRLEFQYKYLTVDRNVIAERSWDTAPGFNAVVPQDPAKANYLIEVSVRSSLNYNKVVTQTFGMTGTGTWCIHHPGTSCAPSDDD